jgi:large subunit ribosomal protein L19
MKAKKYTRETIRELGMYDRGFPEIHVGDNIAVSQRIVEGDKERTQIFEGDVIAIQNNGAASTFTVRKISANSVAVERIFPYYSPRIVDIKFIRTGKVRRAKLYYMRNRIGKAASVAEKVMTREQRELRDQKLAASAANRHDSQS